MTHPLPYPASTTTHTVSIRTHRIPARDGIRLFAMAWHPEGDGPFPAIVNYDPYRSSDMRTLARGNIFHYLARHGFVVLHLNVRGTDGSEGVVTDEYPLIEQTDGYDAVEWIAAQAWCNGNVGMIGTSYSGFTALQVAMHRPPHLKAVIPLFATDDRYTDDVHFTGGAMHALCDLPTWATMMVCLNALPPHASLGPELMQVWQQHLDSNEPYQFNWLAHQTDGPYWRPASLRSDYASVHCAVFIIGGWMDAYRNSTIRIFQHLTSPKKCLIGPWEHVFPDWGMPGPKINFMAQAVRWFDHWLKGVDTGMMDEPPLTVYMQEYDAPSRNRAFTSGYWREARSWPLPGARTHALYLGPNGTLPSTPTAAGNDSFTYKATVGATNRVLGGGPYLGPAEDQRPDELHSLVFTSGPLTERMELLGWARVTLTFASTAPVANVVCKLSDVAPDGASALVTWGILNATHRESHTEPSPLVPGQKYSLEVELHVAAWAFEPGHRIRLAISGADWPNYWPSPYPAEHTVHWGGESGARLTLPIVPNGSADEAPVFGEPVIPLDRYVLRSAPTEMRVIREPLREEAALEFVIRQHGTLPDEPTTYAHDYSASFTASDRDPARAVLVSDHEVRVTRHDSTTTATTHARLASTKDTFHLSFDLKVDVDGVERFQKHWMRSFPRHLM
jgi:hypothetical protein